MSNNKTELMTVPVQHALLKPNLLMGAEKSLLMMIGSFLIIPLYTARSWVIPIIIIALWIVMLFTLRKLAKFDPQIGGIFQKYIGYRKYYSHDTNPYSKGYKH